jgi:light-regulated signal transduction histidine kinase (bacteriophytochrome)
MIEDLLAYSRINTRTLAIEKVNLNDVIEQLEKLDLAKLLEDTGAEINIPEPLPNVQGDPILIRQLIRNLIIHAIKYRKADAHLRIVIRSEWMTADEVKIICENNGIDLVTRSEEHMFKMSLHSHSRQEYEEAGTGLAICKKIVDRHGGRAGIEPKTGVGTNVWFTLPISKRMAPEEGELIVNQADPQSVL